MLTSPKTLSREEVCAFTAQKQLPTLIRYYDDFHDKVRSISHLENSDEWIVHVDGQEAKLDFSGAPSAHRHILKHVVVDLFDRCDPSTVVIYVSKLLSGSKHLAQAAASSASEFAAYWNEHVLPTETNMGATALRSAVQSLCNLSIGQWRPEFQDFLSSLRAPRVGSQVA